MTQFNAAVRLTATDATTAAFRSVAQNASGLKGTLARMESGAARFGQRMAGASASAAVGIAGATRELIGNESALAGVIKTQGYDEAIRVQKQLQGEIKNTGKGLAELNAIASQAATSGISGDDLVDITVLSAQAATAYDMTGESATSALTTARAGFKMTTDDLREYVDVVNYSADGTNALASEILNANQRNAALAASIGLPANALTGFNTAMLDAGYSSEVASTSLKNAMLTLVSGTAATKSQRAAYKQLGLDHLAVAKAMAVDPEGTMVDVFKRIAALAPEKRSAVMTQLFGKESMAIGGLVNGLDAYIARQKEIANGSADGSMAREVANANATMSGRLTIAMAQLRASGAGLAEAFVPAIEKFAELATRAADFFNTLSEGQRQWTAFAVLGVAAAAPVAFAISGIAGALRGVLGVVTTIAPIAARLGVALRGAMIGFAMLTGAGGIGAALGAVGAAATAAAAPIAAIVAGVALLAIGAGAIIRRWGPISDFFAGVWDSIASGVSSAVSAVSDFAGQIASEVGSIASRAAEALGGWAYDLITLVVPPEVVDGVIAKAQELGASIVEGVKAAFTGIRDWFANLFGGIFDAIMGEVVANLKAVAELIPSWARPQALDDWLNADAAKAAAPEAKAAASIAPTIPAADLPAINGGVPAPSQAAAVVAQPTAPVASGPSGAEAAMTAIAASIDARAASIEAALARGGVVKVDTSVRVSGGGQVTGNSVQAAGIARAGDTGVQELGAE